MFSMFFGSGILFLSIYTLLFDVSRLLESYAKLLFRFCFSSS